MGGVRGERNDYVVDGELGKRSDNDDQMNCARSDDDPMVRQDSRAHRWCI